MLKRGFTLIEIVIVLAIGAIIMVVVFTAVQGAQRAQRDQIRRDAANKAEAQLIQFRGNNGGLDPTDWSVFTTNYLTNFSTQGLVFAADVYPGILPACTDAGSTTLYFKTGSPGQFFVCLESGDYYNTP